ncbi:MULTISPECIES: leucine zipper domain-containing protein [unclassified Mesorhizobium]|uniref:leucine zipper domain-containing protein n=1 Tax=unclassified Mesorhizobium TaxID=325217 RepID=UPI00040E24D6|nr:MULTISPECIES: leucine zipper domain-containing protein [unclassified Mesorhizobium]WJI80957.1 leucine zipper domain-containing protein [Mesorhizobium sp. C374B]WJI87496.1 leucine zipper domain-containing protein [Mesorhizobium sp. C372A]
MNIHKNARLTPPHREEMVLSVIEGAFSQAHAARVYGMSAKIVARWVECVFDSSCTSMMPARSGSPRRRQHEKAKNTAALDRRRKRRNRSQMSSTRQPRTDPILLSAT